MDLAESMVSELIQEDGRSKWIASSNHNVKCFTENEVKRITRHYKTILGRGGFGEVYRGVLEDRSNVAVKRFIHNAKENFAKELSVHREINHKGVVRLIGYCLDEDALMMVTEYIPNGNLSDALHRNSNPIPLDTRLRIAIECAEALGYMHSQMYTQVIHGDVKPANILLDGRFRAKISDFGISRLVNTENSLYTYKLMGSIGYMDPLFAQNGRLTAKSDVYSFGVVLLELITRKEARTGDGEINLVQSFTQALAKGIRRVREMFDAEIAIPSDMKTIEEIAKLAGKCLRMEFDGRPDMLEVAVHLRKLREALHQRQERVALFSWGRKIRQERSRIVSFGSTERALELELKDLREAWTEVLGEGTAWTTYKARLPSGAELVFKRLKGVHLPKEEFKKRVVAIGAVRNENIAPLQGYCYSEDERLLLYDYMPMRSLAEELHGNRAADLAPLDWEQRLGISLAAARAVASIHSVGPSSIHGNIKSSNVLLTGTHGEACVSEHGLVTLVGPCRDVWGNRAPEAITGGIRQVSQRDDVYSFGVLLLELITGKDLSDGGTALPREVLELVHDGGMVMVLAMELDGWRQMGVEEKGILQLLQLAIDCCSQHAGWRPAMSGVVQLIEEIRQS